MTLRYGGAVVVGQLVSTWHDSLELPSRAGKSIEVDMVESTIPARWRTTRGAQLGGVLAACVALASGCSGTRDDEFGRVGTDRQPSYKSSTSAPPLEIPPDLTSSSIRDTLAIPGVGATYSQHASGEGGAGTRSGAVVLREVENARIERSGDQRWLVISMTAEEAWPRLRDFWIDQGFAVETEEPDVGVMETDWAAVESPLPAGALKKLTNLINEGLHGVAVRDRYRTRIERGAEAGTTEIYISHRGAEQMYIGDDALLGQQDEVGKMVWQPRPSDPGLEAEMLSRLMIFLGVDEQRATAGRHRRRRRRAPGASRGPGRRHAVDRPRRGLFPSMAPHRRRARPRRIHRR